MTVYQVEFHSKRMSHVCFLITSCKARLVYSYGTFRHKAIQSALQKLKTLRALRNSAAETYCM